MDSPASASSAGAARPAARRSDGTPALVGRLAAEQHGVVTRAQLLAAGLPASRIHNLLRYGRLVRVHASVYRCQDREPSVWTAAAAAVFAAAGGRGWLDGDDVVIAAVSHRTAAALRSYLPEDGAQPVVVSGEAVARVRGVRVHRTRLRPGEAAMLRGIPVTTPARTLLDLAGAAAPRELEQALAAAVRRDPGIPAALALLLRAQPRRSGSGVLRRLLDSLRTSGTAPLFLRSRAEEELLALIRRARLPAPRANQRLLGVEVDFVWPDQRLVVEVDGFEFHTSGRAFSRDRDRDRMLAIHGYQVLRFSWWQLTTDATATVAALAAALAERRRR
jgi:very-short-patch-repair endonuclease